MREGVFAFCIIAVVVCGGTALSLALFGEEVTMAVLVHALVVMLVWLALRVTAAAPA